MQLLLDLQGSLVPEHVRLLLGLPHKPRVERLLRLNRLLPGERWRFWLRHIALPHPYAQQLLNLERHTRSENDGTKR